MSGSTYSSPAHSCFDVIILGGGVVGLTMALALARLDMQVAVVEGGLPTSPQQWDLGHSASQSVSQFDQRVSAINRASENTFRNLDAWHHMVEQRVAPYQYMQVWESKGHGQISFDSAEIAEPNLGHIIENRVMRWALYQTLVSLKNVQLICPAKAVDFWHGDSPSHHKTEAIALQLDNGETLYAQLLVGADGARSWLRSQGEFSVQEKPYGHCAVTAVIKTAQPHEGTARQRFLSNGVLALLPLTEPQSHSIVWSTEPEFAKQLCEMSDEAFKTEFNQAFGDSLGAVTEVSSRVSFPLQMRHARKYVKPRIALIGDAAHTLHPLAGQGVNLGILDATCLAQVLANAYQQQRDLGLLFTLRKYERRRKGDNSLMLFAMSGFKSLFGQESSAIVWARTIGLNLTDKAMPLKYLFVKKAMGLIGELPLLSQRLKS